MYSTMQNFPLTVTSILRHACGVNGDRTVTTATGEGGYRTITYRELGEQAARLANALRRIGITGDERVATFMWNNAEHLAAYLAAPVMGAVLHTLNIRLSPEQIAYIANEAEDRVVVADLSLVAQLAPVLPLLETVHTVIAVGQGDLSPLTASGKTVLRYDDVTAAEPSTFDWPEHRRRFGGRNVLHQRYHGQSERRCVQPSFELPAFDDDLYGQCARVGLLRYRAADRADVSR